MTADTSLHELQRRRNGLLGQLAAIGDFRPGNLYELNRRCGRSYCHCAEPQSPGHPVWQLSRKHRGRSVSHHIPAAAVEQTQAQLEEYQRFRELTDELVEVSDRICQLKAKAAQAAKKGAAQKAARRSGAVS